MEERGACCELKSSELPVTANGVSIPRPEQLPAKSWKAFRVSPRTASALWLRAASCIAEGVWLEERGACRELKSSELPVTDNGVRVEIPARWIDES